MDIAYVCPECRAEHAEPGVAALGHLVVCLDCAIELDLALELNQRYLELAAA